MTDKTTNHCYLCEKDFAGRRDDHENQKCPALKRPRRNYSYGRVMPKADLSAHDRFDGGGGFGTPGRPLMVPRSGRVASTPKRTRLSHRARRP